MTTRSLPDLRFVGAFVTLYELGSVRAAAFALHRTQPAIIYQIRQFERSVGVALFDRVGRRLVPNAAGRRIYEGARTLLDGFTAMQADTARQPVARAARLAVATVSGFGRYVLCPVLYSTRLEGVALRIMFATATDVTQHVESGAVDVGFVYRIGFKPSLEFAECYEEELVLISPRTMRLRARLADITRQPFVTYVESDYVFAKWFDTTFGKQPPGLHTPFLVDELEETLGLVAAGRGLSIVPLDAVPDGPLRSRIRVQRIEGRRCFNSVYSVRRAGGLLTQEISTLLAELGRASGAGPG